MNVSHINEKVFYRFVEFTSRLVKYELSHEDYKLIALDKKEANTENEKKVKHLADSFLYMLNQKNQIIDLEIVKTCYYLLTKTRLNQKYAETLIRETYLHNDDTSYVKAAKLLVIINQFRLRRKLEFSIILANYILIKDDKYPVIFHEVDKKDLVFLLKSKSYRDMIELIHMHEYQTRNGIGQEIKTGVQHKLNDIIDLLKKNQQLLMTSYKVKHMFLYGGIVKGSIHPSSDIDLLVYMDEGLVNYQKHNYINSVQQYLGSILETKLDVLDFSYSLIQAEIKEMNNTIKIF